MIAIKYKFVGGKGGWTAAETAISVWSVVIIKKSLSEEPRT